MSIERQKWKLCREKTCSALPAAARIGSTSLTVLDKLTYNLIPFLVYIQICTAIINPSFHQRRVKVSCAAIGIPSDIPIPIFPPRPAPHLS